jgi:hypothetical protein
MTHWRESANNLLDSMLQHAMGNGVGRAMRNADAFRTRAHSRANSAYATQNAGQHMGAAGANFAQRCH